MLRRSAIRPHGAARPVRRPGRLLEPARKRRSREMTALDKTRLTGPLSIFPSHCGANDMVKVHLKIDPVLSDSACVGTVPLIMLVRQYFMLAIRESKTHVDRCVSTGETVVLEAPDMDAATEFAREVGEIETPATFHVRIEAD